jgi:hypothetical protein
MPVPLDIVNQGGFKNAEELEEMIMGIDFGSISSTAWLEYLDWANNDGTKSGLVLIAEKYPSKEQGK